MDFVSILKLKTLKLPSRINIVNLFFPGLDVFAENLRELLLTLPCRNSVVMGLDPGFKHGCKVAVIDVNGNVLQTGVVYPRVQDLSVKDETFLIESIEKFKVV